MNLTRRYKLDWHNYIDSDNLTIQMEAYASILNWKFKFGIKGKIYSTSYKGNVEAWDECHEMWYEIDNFSCLCLKSLKKHLERYAYHMNKMILKNVKDSFE